MEEGGAPRKKGMTSKHGRLGAQKHIQTVILLSTLPFLSPHPPTQENPEVEHNTLNCYLFHFSSEFIVVYYKFLEDRDPVCYFVVTPELGVTLGTYTEFSVIICSSQWSHSP